MMQARGTRSEIFEVLRETANLEFCTLRNVQEKYFLRQKLREFVHNGSALQEMLKILQRKEK